MSDFIRSAVLAPVLDPAMNSPRTLRAVIFDCDGVLVDSEDLGNRLLIELARNHGFVPNFDPLDVFRGMRLERCLELIENAMGASLPSDFPEHYRAALLKKMESSLKPVDGIKSVLAGLSVPICVASGAPLSKIRFMLERFNLSRFFDGRIYSSYELNLWKPSPELFLYAATQLGVEPQYIGVVEDSPLGVEAGVDAGMAVFHYIPGASQCTSGTITRFGNMHELQHLLPRLQ